MCIEAGKRKEAILTYIRIDQIDKAVDTANTPALARAAAEYLIKQRRETDAAAFYEKLGDSDLAIDLKATKLEKEGDPVGAAETLARAGHNSRAAGIYAKLSHFAEAAHLYAQAEDYGMAAKMYERAGQHDEAGRLYEQAQMWDEAASAYRASNNPQKMVAVLLQGGKTFEAGQMAMRSGDVEGGVQLLSGIAEDDPRYRQAQLQLAKFYRDNRDADKAIVAYAAGLKDSKIGPKSIEPYYWYARLLEHGDDFRLALKILRGIGRHDPNYKDVEPRIKELQVRVDKEDAKAGAGDPNRFTIMGEIGRGGMGVVYRAQDTKLDRLVAYKVLPKEMAENETAVANFSREAKAAAALNHPNIVTVYDAGRIGNDYYIVMELVEGKDLKTVLRKHPVLPFDKVINWARQTAVGLHYAHSKRLVHRDIKPSNLMLSVEGQIKIMDFGLARVLQEVANYQTSVGGTPYYMAPEQVKGGEIDHRTDQYALGVTLYELAVGQVPFPKGDIGYHHINEPVPDPTRRRPDMYDPLWQVIKRMLEKNPDDRFPDTRAMAEALAAIPAPPKG